jgi:hypothetical protein
MQGEELLFKLDLRVRWWFWLVPLPPQAVRGSRQGRCVPTVKHSQTCYDMCAGLVNMALYFSPSLLALWLRNHVLLPFYTVEDWWIGRALLLCKEPSFRLPGAAAARLHSANRGLCLSRSPTIGACYLLLLRLRHSFTASTKLYQHLYPPQRPS